MSRQNALTADQQQELRDRVASMKEEDIDTSDPNARVTPQRQGKIVSSPKTHAAGEIFRSI